MPRRMRQIMGLKTYLNVKTRFLCTLYFRDPAKALLEQVSECTNDEIHHHTNMNGIFTHPLNAEIGKKECTAVERFINWSENVSLSEKKVREDGVSSSVE